MSCFLWERQRGKCRKLGLWVKRQPDIGSVQKYTLPSVTFRHREHAEVHPSLGDIQAIQSSKTLVAPQAPKRELRENCHYLPCNTGLQFSVFFQRAKDK